MTKWTVEINGRMTIIEARTPERAVREAIEDFATVSVREATDDDIAWYVGMGGALADEGEK